MTEVGLVDQEVEALTSQTDLLDEEVDLIDEQVKAKYEGMSFGDFLSDLAVAAASAYGGPLAGAAADSILSGISGGFGEEAKASASSGSSSSSDTFEPSASALWDWIRVAIKDEKAGKAFKKSAMEIGEGWSPAAPRTSSSTTAACSAAGGSSPKAPTSQPPAASTRWTWTSSTSPGTRFRPADREAGVGWAAEILPERYSR